MYFGGKDGSKIYFGKPIIYDDKNAHYMYPNEARMRNMTYGMTIHYDIDIEFVRILEEGEEPVLLGPEFLQKKTSNRVVELTPMNPITTKNLIHTSKILKQEK